MLAITAPFPKYNIPLFTVNMSEEAIHASSEVLRSGYIGQGSKVEEFEDMLSTWFLNQNVLTVNSGTSGLQLVLTLANVGIGDEIISTPMTCQATNQPILHTGAKIVWADIDPNDGNINVKDIEHRITDKTKAIMCVHWGGYPCDMDEINTIAQKHNLLVIEDCAHAFGAEYKDFNVGCLSDFAIFSFQAIKHLTTVDGGALTVRDNALYERGKLLRWYGMNREKGRELRCEDNVPEAGWKYHMNDVAASIGIANLVNTDVVIERHKKNAQFYDERFLRMSSNKIWNLQYYNDRQSSYWLYTILVDDRNKFLTHMKMSGVHCSRVHTRNDEHECFSQFKTNEKLEGVRFFNDHNVCIPVHSKLSYGELNHVMNCIEDYNELYKIIQ